MKPSQIHRELTERIRAENLAIDVKIDLSWIFLRVSGFVTTDFGDTAIRSKRLGKWIAIFPRNRVVEEVARLLPFMSRGKIKLAKFTNISRFTDEMAVVIVYCLDRDQEVATELRQLGWDVHWKYNFETFTHEK